MALIYRAISGHLINETRLTRKTAKTGAVTLIQRFGSALNLNIHFHMLFLDGAYVTEGPALCFEPAAAPCAGALARLVQTIAERIGSHLERAGQRYSRRKFVAGSGALGGMLLAGCDTDQYRPPVIRDGLMGVADVLTMASQRLLLSGQQLAQEHDVSEITANFPVWNESNPDDEEYQRLKAGNYIDWRLPRWTHFRRSRDTDCVNLPLEQGRRINGNENR